MNKAAEQKTFKVLEIKRGTPGTPCEELKAAQNSPNAPHNQPFDANLRKSKK